MTIQEAVAMIGHLNAAVLAALQAGRDTLPSDLFRAADDTARSALQDAIDRAADGAPIHHLD